MKQTSAPFVGGRGCDRFLITSIIFIQSSYWLPSSIITRGSLYRVLSVISKKTFFGTNFVVPRVFLENVKERQKINNILKVEFCVENNRARMKCLHRTANSIVQLVVSLVYFFIGQLDKQPRKGSQNYFSCSLAANLLL